MYVVGAAHAHKDRALLLLDRLLRERKRLVTSTEVMQEILHRYSAISRKEAIQPAFDALHEIVDEVYDVTLADIEKAKDLLLAYEGLSSRDVVHAACMQRRNIVEILSFDRGFDQIPRLRRIS